MFETQTLPSLGPWLSNCRNVILTAHSPCWLGLDITLTVYFCTTCTERNILCKQEQRTPQAKGVTQFTVHCMARGEGSQHPIAGNRLSVCQAPDNSFWCSDICTQVDFMLLLSPGWPLIGQRLSILDSHLSLKLLSLWGRFQEGMRGESGAKTCLSGCVWPILVLSQHSDTNKRPCYICVHNWQFGRSQTPDVEGLGHEHLDWQLKVITETRPMGGEHFECQPNKRLAGEDTWTRVWGAADNNDMRDSRECQHHTHVTML